MTIQTPDWVLYKGRRYQLLGEIKGLRPLLQELGVRPMHLSTAIQRGYEAEYEIDHDQLYLTMLNIGREGFERIAGVFPPIGDVYPVKEPIAFVQKDGKYTWYYDLFYRLKYPMRISAIITIDSYGEDDRHWLAERTREQLERIKELGDKAAPLRPERPLKGPLPPPEMLKFRVIEGYVQAVKDVTQEYKILIEATPRHLDQNAKLNDEEWTKAKKRYHDFPYEEF